MISAFILVSLGACAPLDAGTPSFPEAQPEPFALTTPAPAPSPPGFRLDAGNLVAGTLNAFVISGAPPNTMIVFAYSDNGVGDGPCVASLGGNCVGLAAPVSPLPFGGTTNANGELSLTVNFPFSLGGAYLGMQAATLGRNGMVSNPIGRQVLPGGTVLQPNADLDADGFTIPDGDCDDTNFIVNPGANDSVGDGFDVNCDGSDGIDGDGDLAASALSGGDDCDDTDPAISPGIVDVCNGIDDDCDGGVDVIGNRQSCGRTDRFPDPGGVVAVDVLFVVDNSCSMAEEQAKLTTTIPAFFNSIAGTGVDYHIGVVTTDTDAPDQNGRLQPAGGYTFVDVNTPSPAAIFAQMATVGTSGGINERGRRAAFNALTDPNLSGPNAGFYRDDADLHVVTLSDENDYSAADPTRNEWIDFLLNLKGPDNETYAHSITGPQGGCVTADSGLEYIAVTNAVGGFFQSICDQDYDLIIDRITDEILARYSPNSGVYTLSAVPNLSTLQVRANISGQGVVVVPRANWTYNARQNTIAIVGLTIPRGTTLIVRYDL